MSVITIRPAPPPAIDDYRKAIETLLDGEARTRSYDSAISIATYMGSTNAQWALEAGAFVAWRDAIWAYAYSELEKASNGQRSRPAVSEFLAELPLINWPA
ncbi:hypothetical protein SLT36_20365 [Aminobacter sp. BA135]|uniref:Uncharacterized protein n=1 Tax=Aminobacter aminovorans TaxID=83263 RepID=A0AAC9FE09_AMIAI|nr:hypothetical protein AA2016_4269 [Aminobacter aminovorans]MBB3706268.1 hypothetical protein [Aminobacter aminovorans]MRX34156.1 hypothetical protein [Aminobacter sp. MDW-2]QNH33200.1 hypothetical protein H5P29_22180 [Aminobacter sp. MDW-2]